MKKLIDEKKAAYHLQEHLILENEDGTFEYMSWHMDPKTGKLSWIQGKAAMMNDALFLEGITSEGDEKAIETEMELKYELNQLPKWDNTKYYGVIVDGISAGRMQYSETGAPVQKNEEDYQELKNMLREHGVSLL